MKRVDTSADLSHGTRFIVARNLMIGLSTQCPQSSQTYLKQVSEAVKLKENILAPNKF